MTNKILSTFIKYDFESLERPIIVVYDNPLDFKGHFVARLFLREKPTPVCIVKNTLNEIQSEIPSTFIKLARHPIDDPKIVCIFR